MYSHIVSLPFVLGPYIYFFILILFENNANRLGSIKRLFKIGSATSIPLALLMSMPIFFSHEAITEKTADLPIQFASILKALWILIGGLNSALVISGIVILIGAGLFINIISGHDKNRFFLYLSFLSLVQIIFVIISRPVAGNGPHILARYIILTAPALLIFIASGIKTILVSLNIRLYIQVFLTTAFLFVYLLDGPVPSSVFPYSNATNLLLLGNIIHGKDFQDIALSKMLKRVPEFYKRLAAFPSNTLTIVESPYHLNGYHIFIYQLVHHQNVLMGFINGLCSENRLDEVPHYFKNIKFDNFILLREPSLLDKRNVDFVVFHKRLINETKEKPEHLHQDVSLCIEQYRTWFGVPEFEDRDIIVFSVKQQKDFSRLEQ